MSNINQLVLEAISNLPSDYTNFISAKKYIPNKDKFKCKNHEFMVNRFFNKSEVKSNSLNIPIGMIAIADDPSGNLILLGISKSNSGKVYFWNHEVEDGDTTLIANSFTEFLNKLY